MLQSSSDLHLNAPIVMNGCRAAPTIQKHQVMTSIAVRLWPCDIVVLNPLMMARAITQESNQGTDVSNGRWNGPATA
jgi:hypothetical protein